MKKKDFVKDKKGFIYRCNTDVTPTGISIHEIEIHTVYECWAYAWDYENEESIYVEPKDIFYTYEDAKKALLKLLSKMHQKFMKEIK